MKKKRLRNDHPRINDGPPDTVICGSTTPRRTWLLIRNTDLALANRAQRNGLQSGASTFQRRNNQQRMCLVEPSRIISLFFIFQK